MLSGYVIKTFFGLALGAYMWNENRRRDKKLAGEGKTLGARDGEEEGMNDLTGTFLCLFARSPPSLELIIRLLSACTFAENQNPHFRYLL